MPTQRTKLLYNRVPQSWGPGEQTLGYFESIYWSNRESGQIVKRESPWNMDSWMYTRSRPMVQNLNIMVSPLKSLMDSSGTGSSGAYAKAYRRFKAQAEMPSAELLLNVVERRKSLEMIAARAFQLRNLANSLRKGRLGDAWNYMSANPDLSLLAMKGGRRADSKFVSGNARLSSIDGALRWRQLVKDVASIVLEYRYGWSPLMADIKNACDVLSQPIPAKVIVARGSSTKISSVRDGSFVEFPAFISDKVTIKGQVKVTNPMLDLSNRLGILNLAYVAWEAIPFSFIIDWFLPVGNFLNSFTDFLGLELTDASVTYTYSATIPKFSASWVSNPTTGAVSRDPNGCSLYGKRVRRTVGLSTLPRPPLMAGNGLSPGRAVNAVALLLQTLNPRKGAQIRREQIMNS